MKIFERFKELFFRKKLKRIGTGENSDKVIVLAKKEKNPERLITILSNYAPKLNSDEIFFIIDRLPLNNKIEAMKLVKKYITPYDTFEFIQKKLDYTRKIEALEEFQNQLDLEDIYSIFDSLPPDKRTVTLEKCIDRFDSFSLSELIKLYIPLSERADVLYEYDKLLDSFSKCDIIKKLSPDDTLTAMDKYKDELPTNEIQEIINLLPTNKVADALSVVQNVLSPNQISEIIVNNIPDFQRLDSLIKYQDKLDSAIITDIIKYNIPQIKQEEALLSLKDKLDSNHIAEIIQYYIPNSGIVEKLKDKLFEEDIEFFKENIC